MPVFATGRLLKAESLLPSAVPVSFAYADIESRCDAQLLAAEEEARLLIQEATEQAEQLRAEARRLGHVTGSLQAEAEFEEAVEVEVQLRVEERLRQLVPALQSATMQLVRDREQILLHSESAVVRLALALAERIVRREIETKPAAPQALISEVLQLSGRSTSVKLHLNPADVKDIEDHSADWQHLLATQTSLTIVPDPQVSRGGCLLETAAGEIDGTIETQLARIAEELIGSDP